MGLIVPAVDCLGHEIRKGDVIRNIHSGETAIVTGAYWSQRHGMASIEFQAQLPVQKLIQGTTATHMWQVIGAAYAETSSMRGDTA